MRLLINNSEFIETQHGEDISLVLTKEESNPRAWYVGLPSFEPVRANGFVGSVAEGGNVNFRDIYFNPHGHGTHTECYGHICKDWVSVNDCLTEFWFPALLITVDSVPYVNEKYNEVDQLITLDSFRNIDFSGFSAVVIRTLPNGIGKKSKNYSASNPAYFDARIADLLVKNNIEHLLVDLPSVDREMDDGELAFHHRFWTFPQAPRKHATITEFVYVDSNIPDGRYMLNLQIASFNNDAAPSKPILYPIERL